MMNCIEAFTKLGLPFNADLEAIKKAYRGLTLQNHPDRAKSTEDKETRNLTMVDINLAKEAAVAYIEKYGTSGGEDEDDGEDLSDFIAFILLLIDRGYTHFSKCDLVIDVPNEEQCRSRKKPLPKTVDDILSVLQRLRFRNTSSVVAFWKDREEFAWIELEDWYTGTRWCMGFFKHEGKPRKKPPPRPGKTPPPPPPKPAHVSFFEEIGRLVLLKEDSKKGSQVWGLQGSDHTILVDGPKVFLVGPFGIQLGVADLAGFEVITKEFLELFIGWLARIKADV